MTLTVMAAVLGAAFLHALWNALIKTGGARVAAMVLFSLVQGGIGLAVALAHPWPPRAVWPWLIAAGLIHSAYKIFLTFAYEHGDLAAVYPLARGTAPLIVLAVSALALAEPLTAPEALGIAVLGAGILTLARGVWAGPAGRRMLPFALAAATATAGYTLVDGLGARAWGQPQGFVGWMFLLDGIGFTLAMAVLHGPAAILPRRPGVWLRGAGGALASYASYAIVVWAMTQAPIALVAGLRETSILFAVLIGRLLFAEAMSRGRWIAVGLIAAGVILTRL